MNSSYTPGPYITDEPHYDGSDTSIGVYAHSRTTGKSTRLIAEVIWDGRMERTDYEYNNELPPAELLANAKLFKEAPETLGRLEKIMSICEGSLHLTLPELMREAAMMLDGRAGWMQHQLRLEADRLDDVMKEIRG